jgi:hypothetical protein
MKYLLEAMGSGVAIFDYDNDGRMDLFFANAAALKDPMPKAELPDKQDPQYWNRLYHQKNDSTFEDVTESAGLKGTGYSTGVAAADYDNDGYTDLYVTGYASNFLYHNNGDGTFTDVTKKTGVGGDDISSGTSTPVLSTVASCDPVIEPTATRTISKARQTFSITSSRTVLLKM